MRRLILVTLSAAIVMCGVTLNSSAQLDRKRANAPRPLRPVHTFSIVARDPSTGELGVAVQSHWFSVGSVVPWAEAGVGRSPRNHLSIRRTDRWV